MDYYEEYKVLMAAKKSTNYYEEVLGAMTPPPPTKAKESIPAVDTESEEIKSLKSYNELFETLYIVSLFVTFIMIGMLTVIVKYNCPGPIEKATVLMAWALFAVYCYYGYFKFRSAEKKHKR